MFEDVTDDWNKKDGGERHVRTVSENCWISVLHRMTGFGYMEWETAICFRDPELNKHANGSPMIIRGDWRAELVDVQECDLVAWYLQRIPGNQNSFDSALGFLNSLAKG